MRLRVFTLLDHYLPGYRHGGPVRTLANMVAQLPELEFWIFTRDRDQGDRAPYPEAHPGAWGERGAAHVWYAAPGRERIRDLREALERCRPEVVYSNSLFSSVNVRYLVARRLGLLPRTPFVLAPRGELSPGAMALKRLKKMAFLHAASGAGLFRGVIWQASTELERAEIEAQLAEVAARPAALHVAKDLFDSGAAPSRTVSKSGGVARFAFVSRLSRKKNLSFAIERLAAIGGKATLSVFGPIEDVRYWDECRERAANLDVKLAHRGAVPPDEVPGVFADHDFFVFPTLGENFGHVIVEALLAGCPVVLSDRTPWNAIEARGAGWTVPLEDHGAWEDVLRTCIAMDSTRHEAMSRAARTAAVELGGLGEARLSNAALFASAAKAGWPAPGDRRPRAAVG